MERGKMSSWPKIKLNDLKTILQITNNIQAELEKTRQDLENLRQVLSLYIKDLKLVKAKVNKRLKTLKNQVTSLKKT